MDKAKLLDYGATMGGGGMGLEQVYEAMNLLGTAGPSWAFTAALLKGLMLLVFGYFAFRGKAQTTQAS